jgi:hypothetical protein
MRRQYFLSPISFADWIPIRFLSVNGYSQDSLDCVPFHVYSAEILLKGSIRENNVLGVQINFLPSLRRS